MCTVASAKVNDENCVPSSCESSSEASDSSWNSFSQGLGKHDMLNEDLTRSTTFHLSDSHSFGGNHCENLKSQEKKRALPSKTASNNFILSVFLAVVFLIICSVNLLDYV